MICRLASLLLGTMPSPRLRLELVATISVSQGLARTGRLSVCALSHNTLNRISYWRALKSQIIHGGSTTIVLTVAFCSKDNSGGREVEGDTAKCLPIVCQLSHCSAASLYSAICGRAAHIARLSDLVDVLTESCRSSRKVFLLLLTQCIAAASVTAAATATALAHTGGRGGGGGYGGGGGMCGGCCCAVQWGFLCKEIQRKK